MKYILFIFLFISQTISSQFYTIILFKKINYKVRQDKKINVLIRLFGKFGSELKGLMLRRYWNRWNDYCILFINAVKRIQGLIRVKEQKLKVRRKKLLTEALAKLTNDRDLLKQLYYNKWKNINSIKQLDDS